jgi:hypothetical protein
LKKIRRYIKMLRIWWLSQDLPADEIRPAIDHLQSSADANARWWAENYPLARWAAVASGDWMSDYLLKSLLIGLLDWRVWAHNLSAAFMFYIAILSVVVSTSLLIGWALLARGELELAAYLLAGSLATVFLMPVVYALIKLARRRVPASYYEVNPG